MNTPSRSILDQAMAFLAYREHSTSELAQKLQARHYPPEEINEVIQELCEMNYLNEARFIESFIRSKANKLIGPLRIKQELLQKGITQNISQQALDHYDIDWFELARKAKEKKFNLQWAEDYHTKAKQIRHLQSRGFDYDQIQYALDPENQGDH